VANDGWVWIRREGLIINGLIEMDHAFPGKAMSRECCLLSEDEEGPFSYGIIGFGLDIQ